MRTILILLVVLGSPLAFIFIARAVFGSSDTKRGRHTNSDSTTYEGQNDSSNSGYDGQNDSGPGGYDGGD